jgi:hypothetical protein
MQNVILSLRKIFDNLVLIELDILDINVSMQHAILFFPTLKQVKTALQAIRWFVCCFCLCLSRRHRSGKCVF